MDNQNENNESKKQEDDETLKSAPEPEKETEPQPEAETEVVEENTKKDIPPRKKNAIIRCIAAGALAVVLLCLTGFGAFKLMAGGKNLTAANMVRGRYLTFNVDTILDYLAEDYKPGTAATAAPTQSPAATQTAESPAPTQDATASPAPTQDATASPAPTQEASATDTEDTGTVTGRYVIVPVNGQIVIVHLPQRYLESGNTVAVQTYYQLYGYSDADKYFVASGTVKKAPQEIVDKYQQWFTNSSLSLYQYGFISNLDQTSIEYIVDVDSTGLFNDTWCIVVTALAGVSLIYALVLLILIKKGRYNDDITVELFEMDGEGDTSEEPADVPDDAETPELPEETGEDEKQENKTENNDET